MKMKLISLYQYCFYIINTSSYNDSLAISLYFYYAYNIAVFASLFIDIEAFYYLELWK